MEILDRVVYLPDRDLRLRAMIYAAPDGGRYFAPLGTPAPEPGRALSPVWLALPRNAVVTLPQSRWVS